MLDLKEFREELLNEVAARRESGGGFSEGAFTEFAGDSLIESNVIDSFYSCGYSDSQGKFRLDGYSFDDVDDSLMVCIVEWSGAMEVSTLTQAEIRSTLSRLAAFLRSITDGSYTKFVDVGDAAYDFALVFLERLSALKKIRAFLVSDMLMSSRIKDWPEGVIANVPVEFHIWDVARFHNAFESRSGLDEIEISLAHLPGGGLPCLPAGLGASEYEGYLTVLPAAELAAIYEKYGSRLLEGNVRSFLSARGKINQGIRRTLLTNHSMFFAYNNGISCVATGANVVSGPGGLLLTSITDLQIVNGGQTTASIANVDREEHVSTLDRTFVPMKLSIVQGDRFTTLMKDISLFANSQNRVTDSDLASNDPFQIRMEEISRRITAPAVGGLQYSTHWYYERARGQYANEVYKLRERERASYRLLNPKSQVVTKLDLARVLLCERGLPHIVAQGAQKMITELSKIVRAAWEVDRQQFGDLYYRDIIAGLIIYRQFESRLINAKWYVVGYKSIIAAYAYAWLLNYIVKRKLTLDHGLVWRAQRAPEQLIENLLLIGNCLFEEMNTKRDGRTQNVTQLAKRHAFWEDARRIEVSLTKLDDFTCTVDLKAAEMKESRVVRVLDDGIEAQKSLLEHSPQVWKSVLSWYEARGPVEARDRTALLSLARERGVPNEKQALRLLQLLSRAEGLGFIGDV